MEIINILIPIIIGLIVLSFPVFLVVAIVSFVEAKDMTNPVEKKRHQRKAWKILLFPFVLMIVVVTLWGLLNVVQTAVQGV